VHAQITLATKCSIASWTNFSVIKEPDYDFKLRSF
jgi:hypothetical protein